jgi:hypothetical protein
VKASKQGAFVLQEKAAMPYKIGRKGLVFCQCDMLGYQRHKFISAYYAKSSGVIHMLFQNAFPYLAGYPV